MKVLITAYLDTRRAKADEKYPLKLRLTVNRKQYYQHLSDLSLSDWEKIQSRKYLKNLEETDYQINQELERARNIADGLKPFNIAAFNKAWERDFIDRSDIIDLLSERMKNLKQEGRFGTAYSLNSTIAAIKAAQLAMKENAHNIPLSSIDEDWLNRFESWMLDNGRSETTLGIYCRNMRTIFNQEIGKNNISASLYPFGKGRYTIPQSRKRKLALGNAELKRIFEYQGATDAEERALCFWKLLYLASGMNIKDVALLEHTNYDEYQLHFLRAKTRRSTKGNLEEIVVPLIPESIALIEKLKVQRQKNNNLIFDLIDGYASPEKKHKQTLQASKTINKYMQRIAQNLEIKAPITTYTARHSYATKLKRSGASSDFIRESLGHKSLSTTEKYLASFDMDTKRSFQSELLNF
jgi:integrase/recombinase XerD